MKYYIPTSSLNYNNILSTESISPKVFYEKRDFGYTRWFSVEENNIDRVTLLYDSMCFFERPLSDIEDHAMLVEITCDDDFPKLAVDGVFYSDKTIYLNPWQTKFIFFDDKVKRTVMSMSDSSLETKLVRLYQRKMVVQSNISGLAHKYPIVSDKDVQNLSDFEANIEEDYIINKMKGLLYGYYIGANLSSTKEHIQKMVSLREINNIFASVMSSYDKIPSNAQKTRLDEIFNYLEKDQPIYKDLEGVLGSVQLVDSVFAVFQKYGYKCHSIDRNMLINALQSDGDNNLAINWINREMAKANSIVKSSTNLLNPENAEIIVSSKDRLVSQKSIDNEMMKTLFQHWINKVLCSHSFNGKVNSIKEQLSDEITRATKEVIGADWDNSPVRTYLNQLRRHVRGEEFNQTWDNGVLSSMAAVLIKGDDWEQLLQFMQKKEMYDYRLAFAIYGVLNGFANMTRDFTDQLLTKESRYLSSVYREFYGQLHEKSIPNSGNSSMMISNEEVPPMTDASQTIIIPESNSISQWKQGIKKYAESIIKRDKAKLLKSLEDAFVQNADNQDYFVFITMLDNFDGWKPGKNGPSTAWKRMQEHYVPDYDQHIGKSIKKQTTEKRPVESERNLFNLSDGIQHAAQTMKKVLTGNGNETELGEQTDVASQETKTMPISRVGKSILEETSWIQECASLVYDARANRQFVEDMEWFVGNHNDTYNDKKKGLIKGYYAGHDRTNIRVKDRLKSYMENKVNPKNEKMKWLVDVYANIPIDKIIDYISRVYGI